MQYNISNVNTPSILNKGFSLIELAVVLMIMGLLASLVMPKLGNIVDIAKVQTLKSIGHTTQMGIESYQLMYGTYPIQSQDNLALFTTLKSGDSLSAIPINPYTGHPYEQAATDGKVNYIYDAASQSYQLSVYGAQNSKVIMTVSN